MSELVYSIKQIFSTDKGALADCKVSQYYIAPYQRGYKWASFSQYDQVPQMLTDIYEAYINDADEYFLQYITVKNLEHNNKDMLEIIDGQQRLTTLSIFFYVISQLYGESENIAKDRLVYYRYERESYNIFEKITQTLKNQQEEKDCHIIRQDEFYMLKAARNISMFLELLKKENKLEGYNAFVQNKVKIIFNLEDENTKSEEIFENLNGNKVELSNMYLIKGLLLTNAVIRHSDNGRAFTYKEILDQRTIMGRMWDEIVSWTSREDVAHYFFARKRHDRPDGMEYLLKLVLHKYNKQNVETDSLIQEYYSTLQETNTDNEQQSKYKLFNRYNRLVNGGVSATELLNDIKHTYRVLLNIWSNCELYNILGYVRFASIDSKVSANTIPENWVYKLIRNGNAAKCELVKQALAILPDMEDPQISQNNYDCLRYSSNNANLTRLLLSFSVFPENRPERYMFNFYRYDNENWTFEHLSPQNPKKSIKIPNELKQWVIKRICEPKKGDDIEQTNLENQQINTELKNLINDIKSDKEIETDKLDFLFDSNIDEHFVGNMALLDGGSNSSVSNNPFVIKRSLIIKKINENRFVPIHTISVYEKSINTYGLGKALNPDLFCWSEDDSKAHAEWMVRRNKEIREYLKKIQ